jgi:hypothetical protein
MFPARKLVDLLPSLTKLSPKHRIIARTFQISRPDTAKWWQNIIRSARRRPADGIAFSA